MPPASRDWTTSNPPTADPPSGYCEFSADIIGVLGQRVTDELRRAAPGPPRACSHLTGGAWWICGQHPTLGLFCGACAKAHVGRHPRVGTCAGCGATEGDEVRLSPLKFLVVRPAKVRLARGATIRNTADVFVLALALCPACRAGGANCP